MSVVALVDDAIPMVCFVADILRILRISRAQYFRLRKKGLFPIPEILPRVGDPRYLGADVRRYLNGEFGDRVMRRWRGTR